MSAVAACTIVSANYIAFARVLARSFRTHHPEGRFFVLLVDRNEGRIDPDAEPFELVEVEDLDEIPERDGFLFKYTLLECNTAVKPYFLAHLLKRFDLPALLYLDPDILVTRPLQPIAEALTGHDIVLTPHLTDPIEDAAHPGELAILQAGAYNLGFIGLRRGPVTDRLLAWWQDRLFDRCVVRIGDGLFVDQKWIDLVPGLFGDAVAILDHPGLNVAYWNLHGREVTTDDDGPEANGRPLCFFHFSGIDPENLGPVSKHQDRFVLDDLGGAAALYQDYAGRVLAEGHREARPWPYAFARFDHGAKIPDLARRMYLDLGPRRRRFGNPFEAGGDDSFFAWLKGPRRGRSKPPYLSRLLDAVYRSRSDLAQVFPDVEGRDFPEFCAWLTGYGRWEMGIDEAFLDQVHQDSRATLFTVPGLQRRLKNRAKRLYHSDMGRGTRQAAKRLLGHERAEALRERLRPRPLAVEDGTDRLAPARLAMPTQLEHRGINVVGYFRAETGMGQAARAVAGALEAAGVPHARHSIDLNVIARTEDDTYAPTENHDFPYDVSLFVVNADQVPALVEHLGGDVFGGRYNIGLWLWELEHFPRRFSASFDVLHEIWTPSTFCVDAISAIAPIPVRRLALPVAPKPETIDRGAFGIPEDAFAFLFTFNFLSYAERKNPLAVVRAFRRAFSAQDDAVLVLKTSQSDFAPAQRQALDEAIGDARVVVIDRYLDRGQTDGLTAAADAYVSLHRSEGFGLTVAEAMALGTPVIATPYGGVTDFFDLNNGYPVRFERVPLTEAIGPYPAGAHWAEPDEAHAAERMRTVYEQRAEAAERARRAREDISQRLSPEAVGTVARRHFETLCARVDRQQLGRLL